ncbi:MAG: L-histidine N(alpha)-methyltransferase [Oleispira sp.]|nr:L-histidine N(alpha)-methyltransferase [Oleispira sp.]MBL4880880.1 L-histidine N(alpha)-methyltransferase [Oleispira sp.]
MKLNPQQKSITNSTRRGLRFFDNQPVAQDILTEVIAGLSRPQKVLPAKYFYDEQGSKLFEAITKLPEYYPTRIEINLLRQHREAIAKLLKEDVWLLEYGSGASLKIRLLLQAIKPNCYVPMDISKDFLLASAESLMEDYPWLNVYAACVDYSQPIRLPADMITSAQKLGFFPGSSIGNFSPQEAQVFLQGVRNTLGKDGAMLIGIDLQKDKQVLEAAYNDCQNVTAAFNFNILHHINRVLGTQFNVDYFEHKAIYSEEKSRIEMHLVSTMDQIVRISDSNTADGESKNITFKTGESIHTENSYKYSKKGFTDLVEGAGFEVRECWSDDKDYFAMFYLHCC